MEKRYLGDAVHVHADNGLVTLTTEDGYGVTNTIHMEDYVVSAFINWIRDTGCFRTALREAWREVNQRVDDEAKEQAAPSEEMR